MENNMSIWKTLSAIDCSDHTEKKAGMTYLSWAWAWMIVKQHYPEASFIKWTFESDHGKLPYMLDPNGYAYVQVTVYIDEESATEVYPVLDHRNKGIQNPNSFDVNKAHQRCLVKALAYMGLGVTIYAGEDLPLSEIEDKKEQDNDEESRILQEFLGATSSDELDDCWRINSQRIGKLGQKAKDRLTDGFKKKKVQIRAA